MKHTFTAVVENSPSVLYRICSLFQRVNRNIESLAVGQSEIPGVSRMTLVMEGEERLASLLAKQFARLVNVIRVDHIRNEPAVERESTLVRVNASPEKRAEIMELARHFNGGIADVGDNCLTVEFSGPAENVNIALGMLKPYGIEEMARTGRVRMVRATSRNAPKPVLENAY